MGYSPSATQTPTIYGGMSKRLETLGISYLFCHLFHVVSDKVITVWMEEDWETPWIFERHKMRLARVEVEVHDLERADLLLGHLGTLQAFSEGSCGNCSKSTRALLPCHGVSVRVVHIRNAPLYLRRSKSAMMQSIMCGFGVRK